MARTPMFEFGPSGGTGGKSGSKENESDKSEIDALLDEVETTRVEQVEIQAGDIVDSIQFFHERSTGETKPLAQHGGPGGHTVKNLTLQSDEHIILDPQGFLG